MAKGFGGRGGMGGMGMNANMLKQAQKMQQDMEKAQQELADITGIQPPNLARIESGKHIPTLVVLEKYASALGKHIEIKVCDD